MNVAFILSMPGCPSWNGRWSGEGKLHAVIRKVSPKKFASLKPSYGYFWTDGWSACVDIKEVNALESRRLRKASSGFCDYEWMIDSILTYDRILADHEKPKEEIA